MLMQAQIQYQVYTSIKSGTLYIVFGLLQLLHFVTDNDKYIQKACIEVQYAYAFALGAS